MRKVYYGATANGKTRVCEELAQDFRKQGLSVVSNVPTIYGESGISCPPVDNHKKTVLFQDNPELKDIYEEQLSSRYSFFEIIQIKSYLNFLSAKGDVLILDDFDSQLPKSIVKYFIDLLSKNEDLRALWKHVIKEGGM